MILHEETITITTSVVEEPAAPRCVHHWVIQPANGPISQGECQKCGESREFKNSYYDWEDEEDEN